MKHLKLIHKKKFPIIIYILLIISPLFLFCIIQTTFFKKKIKTNKLLFSKRELFSGINHPKTEDFCKKADNNLISLYEKETYDDISLNIPMEKSTSYLYKFLEDNNISEIKKYFLTSSFIIFLIILVIVIIIIWIILLCIVFNDKCFICKFEKKNHNIYLKNILWFINIIVYFILFFLNVIILLKFFDCIKIINNSFCSLFKINYHTYYGEEKNYEIKPKWIGIHEIKNLLQNTKNQISEIIDVDGELYNIIENDLKSDFNSELNKGDLINNHIHKFCDLNKVNVPNPNPLSYKNISNFFYCSDILNLIQNEYNDILRKYIKDINDIYEKIHSIDINKKMIQFSLDNANNKLDFFAKFLNDLEIDYFDTLLLIYEIINNYIIIIFSLFFIFILLIHLIELFSFLSNICCSNSKYCYRLFVFFWNIQMLTLIIVIIISASFNFLYVVIEDLSIIIKSSLYKEQTEFNKTFSYSNRLYDIEGLNICMYENGNLKNYTKIDEGAEPLSHFYSMIKIIKENLNYLIHYTIIVEKNETKKIFDELEKKPYLIKYQLQDDNIYNNYFDNSTYICPEEMLEKELSKYTFDENNQLIGNNSYYSNYFFVYSKDFCNSNYTLINSGCLNNNDDECYYKEGKNCMLLEEYPENNNYFRDIKIKKIENDEIKDIDYYNDLNVITKEFKAIYYDIDNGFKISIKQLLNNSKKYFNDEIEPKFNQIKIAMIKIYNIVNKKINIINDLYENIIGKNNTDLFSAFNCKYLKRDIYIFLNQLDFNLKHSFFMLSFFSFAISVCSLICIILNIFIIKLKKIISENNIEINEKKDIDNNINLNEKPTTVVNQQKYLYDDNLKFSFNEKTNLRKTITNEKKENKKKE